MLFYIKKSDFSYETALFQYYWLLTGISLVEEILEADKDVPAVYVVLVNVVPCFCRICSVDLGHLVNRLVVLDMVDSEDRVGVGTVSSGI